MLKTKIAFLLGNANKKLIIAAGIFVILFVVVLIGVLAAHWKIEKMRGTSYPNLNKHAVVNEKILTFSRNDKDKFVQPEDAAIIGELAIIVEDLDTAKNMAANMAMQNGGMLYSTFISYASDEIKNGSVVLQIPVENFAVTFANLKASGGQIIQESTKKIPIRSISSYSQASVAAEKTLDEKTESDSEENESETVSSQSSAILPLIYPQTIQNKSYIKVVFAAYEKNKEIFSGANNILNINGYAGQNMRNNIWLILSIKAILLIVLIFILVIVAKKIIKNLRKKNNKPSIHIVRQAAKIKSRAVKIKVTRRK